MARISFADLSKEVFRAFFAEHPACEVGGAADLALLDPGTQWTVAPERFLSKGRNTPFCGWELRGRAIGTVLGRKVAQIQETVLKSE